MQYYTFELDDESQDLCIIATPFGLFKYKKLPMGIKPASDIAQAAMVKTIHGIDDADCYIDDVGIWSNSWSDHLKTLRRVLQRIQDDGFALNILKCEFGVTETDWLGFWMTPIGLKPWKKRVDPILHLAPPKDLSAVRAFIGAVAYYRDMFQHRSHILAPLTDLTKGAGPRKRKITWSELHQTAFDKMKALIARDVLMRYPDHNLPFHVYTDASDLQLGSVILQGDAPVAYFSRKLNAAQRNYSTIEKELLSIVETLKEYRTMLYGCVELHIYTDHKNLTYNKLSSQKVMRWRLFIEEFQPIFHYVKGADNIIADALSRLPRTEGQGLVTQPASPGDVPTIQKPEIPHADLTSDTEPDDTSFAHHSHYYTRECRNCSRTTPNESNQDDEFFYAFSVATDDDEMLECLLNYPDLDANTSHLLDYQAMATAQQNDADLLHRLETSPAKYSRKLVEDVELIIYTPTPEARWRICIPDEHLDATIKWYHQVLNHIGIIRLYKTIALHFYNRHLRTRIELIVKTCDACQRSKLPGKGYAELPPREPRMVPWQEIAVDLIGPWTIKVHERKIIFRALTIIDTTTNLAELIRIHNKSAAHVGLQLENAWLSRYPRPEFIIYDQGSEFLGEGFQRIIERHRIHPHPTSVKAPTANGICERLHQTVSNVLRPLISMHPPQNIDEAGLIVDSALQTASFSARAAIHSTMGVTPGAVAFSRDMLLNIPFIADLQLLKDKREQLIHEQLLRSNRSRISHDYRAGDEILILTYKPDKLDDRAVGPFRIEQVHVNGTVTIRRNANITERINIRRIKPYRR